MSTQTKNGIVKGELLTAEEAATYLRVSRMTIWRWCKQGIIPAFRIGRNWRIRQNDLFQLEKSLLGETLEKNLVEEVHTVKQPELVLKRRS